MDWYAIFKLLSIFIIPSISFFLGIYFAQYILSIKDIRGNGKMPIAVVVDNVSDKMPLKTLPPDGYVIVRRMTYGESLSRSAKATKLLVGGSDSKNKDDFKGEIDIQTEELAYWDFANLIVEHNCQDVDGRVLNFKNISDVKKLGSAIGEEIGEIIDKFNEVEDTEEVKNS